MEVVVDHPGLEVAGHQQQYGQPHPYSTSNQDTVPWDLYTKNQDDHIAIQEAGRGKNWTLIITAAVAVTALIVGGAVGGGLGASLASCKTDPK
jgi:hypothetical protein